MNARTVQLELTRCSSSLADPSGLTVRHQEELNSKDSCSRERPDRPLSQLLCALVDSSACSERAEHEAEDAVLVNGLNGVVALDLARRRAYDHDGNLLGERSPPLGVKGPVSEVGECLVDVVLVGRLEDEVAPAVVRERPRLEHQRKTKLSRRVLDRLLDVVVALYADKVCDCDSVVDEELLLLVLVLDDLDRLGRRVDLDLASVLNFLEHTRVDVLNLDGEDVDLCCEREDVRAGCERSVEVAVMPDGGEDDLLGRRVGPRVEDQQRNMQ